MDTSFKDCPPVLKDFLFFIHTIKGLSNRTVDGYFIDLRTFFRFIRLHKGLVDQKTPFNEISIKSIDIDIIKSITLADTYEFLHYIATVLANTPTTRSRKASSIRAFFHYLNVKVHLIDDNPMKELEVPNIKKRLPKYLSLEQCLELLKNVDGTYKERDYCILTLFLNCGMRLSELVGISLPDISENTMRLRGKGDKERIIYLNDACLAALAEYKAVRCLQNISPQHKAALFLTRAGKRISNRRVQEIVEHNLDISGLSSYGFSTHKLRHSAATLMYQHGGVDIRVLQEILGHSNLGTTEIYTHISSKQMENAINGSPLANVKKGYKKSH